MHKYIFIPAQYSDISVFVYVCIYICMCLIIVFQISKMEMQQQQQQLISMEGIDNSNFRALIVKLLNVILAVVGVVLVFVSTVANVLGPFLTTRYSMVSGNISIV